MKQRHTIPPGQVLVQWRMSAAWRDGDARLGRWHWYGCFTPRDAETFMEHKAPNTPIFQFRITHRS